MEGPRPIDVYGGCISALQSLRKEFLDWSERSSLRHQLILWQGPGDPPSREAWEKFLLAVGVFPFEPSAPDEKAEFHFLPDASRCNSFRWLETPRIREEEYDALREFEQLTLRAYGGLHSMLDVHDWCLPGKECSVPKWFWLGRDPPFGMKYPWLQFLYECAAEWPVIPNAPAWMPKPRELTVWKTSAKLIESQNVWALSAEAISRWLPPDVDDFMSAWKEIGDAIRAKREEARPHWDAEESLLTYNRKPIKRFKQPAENQKAVLAAFEKARWPNRISASDVSWDNPTSKQRDSTVRELNKKHITKDQMHFAMDGTKITWGRGPKPPSKLAK
jgi:hypothetical protein